MPVVTIKDISQKCGVSPATVSKALNGYGDISESTRELVQKTAKEMHYRPNAAARQLKTNSSHNLGIVYIDSTGSGLAHEFFSGVIDNAKDEAEKRGYDVTFISSALGYGSYLEHCRYRKCDGVLIVSEDFTSRQVYDLVYSEIPTVTIDYVFDGHSSVLSKNVEGEYQLTRYLINKGHRKIAFIHGEMTSVTKKRLSGFYNALAEAGIEVPDEYLVEAVYHDPSSSEEATRALMSLKDRPTAIMYPDDYSYLGGMMELERLRISIPDDVSVVGFDGIRLSQVLRPRLTTYYQDAPQMGRASVRKLVHMIENRKTCMAEEIEIPGRLLEGDSVAQI
ncbi:MAG: LacI family DNA-binding transcriptional regulator [Lachnospiraceae bacterium]|nr:LacI family DNA-binding transcriptional regulator [Lachnospiraceae bacterium]